MPLEHKNTETVSISRVTGGYQELSTVQADISLTGDQWEKHSVVTGPEAPCILSMDYLRRGYFKDLKGYCWAFGVATGIEEKSKQLSTLPDLSEDPSIVGLLRVKDEEVPIAMTTIHRRQYQMNRDAVIPIHKMIRKLESQGVVSRTHSPFNSPIWPVCKSNGERRLTVDYCGFNEVMPPLSAAVPAECRPQFAFTWRGVQYTWNRLSRGWKHSRNICHELIQATLEKGKAPEHIQYINDIIVWGDTAEEVFKKGQNIFQILLEAGFTIGSFPGLWQCSQTCSQNNRLVHQNNTELGCLPGQCFQNRPNFNKIPHSWYQKCCASFELASCQVSKT
ncbi:uncharacterized protein LOC127471397 [Manacus candei]|uniref:uncharacterized protein LOC127471397 n=1 Tax=Manacus candei TaxID=415023 RepID=UPI002225D6DD|nr:uncharacterized protein LOC127471397 [Manacus candei]